MGSRQGYERACLRVRVRVCVGVWWVWVDGGRKRSLIKLGDNLHDMRVHWRYYEDTAQYLVRRALWLARGGGAPNVRFFLSWPKKRIGRPRRAGALRQRLVNTLTPSNPVKPPLH